MKSIHTKFILIACLALSSSSVLAQSIINCDLLPGNWAGEHTDNEGNYSRWIASYSVDGNLGLTFFDVNDKQASIQEGTWTCNNGALSTTMMSGLETLEFDYEILSLDQDSISYRSLFDETVFHSNKLDE